MAKKSGINIVQRDPRDLSKGFKIQADSSTVLGNAKAVTTTPSPSPTQRKMIYTRKDELPKEWDTRSALAQIARVGETDPIRATSLLNYFNKLQNTASSKYYNPYTQPTNQAIGRLAAYGIDTSVIDDDFFRRNNYLLDYLSYNGTSNTPSQPGKKASVQEKAAYEYYQIVKSENETKEAEKQWKSLQDDITYWTNRKDLNLTDDQILERIDWSKYGALTNMDKNKIESLPEFNRAIGYSQSALYGVIWQARNPEANADIYSAMANSYLGRGNVWKQNDKIAKDREENPYRLGNVNINDDMKYFGIDSVTEDWLDENEHLALDGTDEEKKHIKNLITASNNSKAANEALKALSLWEKRNIKEDTTPEQAKSALDSILDIGYIYVGTGKNEGKVFTESGKNRVKVDLNILNKMDLSLGKGEGENKQRATGNMVPMTEGIDYKYSDYLSHLGTVAATVEKKNDSETTLANLDPLNGLDVKPDMDKSIPEDPIQAAAKAEDKKSIEIMDGMSDLLTPSEEAHAIASPGVNTDQLAQTIYDAKTGNNPTAITPKITAKTAKGDAKAEEGNAKAEEGNVIPAPYNQSLNDPEWIKQMATKIIMQTENKYIDTAFKSLEIRTRYENYKAAAEELQDEINAIELWYGDAAMIKNAPGDVVTMTSVDFGDENMPLTFRRGEDGEYHFDWKDNGNVDLEVKMDLQEQMDNNTGAGANINRVIKNLNERDKAVQAAKKRLDGRNRQELELSSDGGAELAIPFVFDISSNEYTLSPDFDSRSKEVADYLEQSGETEDDLWRTINNHIGELNKGFEEEQKTLNTKYAQLDYYQDYMTEHKNEYEAAVKAVEDEEKHRNRTYSMVIDSTKYSFDPRYTDGLLSYVGSLTDVDLPEEQYDSIPEILRSSYMRDMYGITDTDEEVAAQPSMLREQAADYRALVKNYEGLPDYYKKKLTSFANWYESRARQYDAYLLTLDDNFSNLVEEGKHKSVADRANIEDEDYVVREGSLGFFQMTTLEKDIYYALYASKGADAAEQWYKDIEGSLVKRSEVNIEENTKEMANKGLLGKALCELYSIKSAILEVPLNIAYLIESALGMDQNHAAWLRMPSQAAKHANEAVINALKEEYKGTIWGTILPAAVEMMNFRGRSRAIASTWSGLIPDIAGSDALNNIVHAIPMSTIAFAEGYQDATRRNLSELQSWALGGVNFISEAVTEGIRYGHMKPTLDQNITFQSLKDILVGKLSDLEWLSEGTGETINNIAERVADRWIAGDKSIHDARVQNYIQSGLVSSKEEAEAMVLGDYVKEDVHTFVVSALADFLDLKYVAFNKMMSTAHYAVKAAQYNKSHEDRVSIHDLRERDIKLYKAADEIKAEVEKAREDYLEELKKPHVPKNPANVSETIRQQQEGEYDSDFLLLENSMESDQKTVTATIAAVLRAEGQDPNRANAAAVKLVELYGKDAMGALQDLLIGGKKSGTNINTLKIGIQYALLAEGACNSVLDLQDAGLENIAKAISDAAQKDATNPDIRTTVANAVHENRVYAVQQELLAQEDDNFYDLLNASLKAKRKTSKALYDLQKQRAAEKVAEKAVQDAGIKMAMDNSADSLKLVKEANARHKAAVERTQQLEAEHKNAEQAQAEAENKFKTYQQDALNRARQEAEARVQQQEAGEAEALAQQVEEKRIADEQQAAAEQEARDRANLALTDAEGFVQKYYPDATDEEKQRILTRLQYVQNEQNSRTPDALMARKRVIGGLLERFGIDYEIRDTTVGNEGQEVKIQPGKVNPATGKITFDSQTALSDVMYFVLGHELLHIARRSSTYNELADTLLKAAYGENYNDPAGQLAADIAAKQRQYKDYTTEMHEQDSTIPIQDLDPENAKEEIVADLLGKMFRGDNGEVNIEMISRLAGEKPNLARRILNSIKTFLNKIRGYQDPAVEQINTVRKLLETALNERKGTYAKEGGENKLSLEQEATPIVENKEGDSLAVELPGGTVALDERYSLSTFGDEEQERVRKALLDRKDEYGNPEFTKEEVDKYMEDATNIAKAIAADKLRLDFEASDNQVFLKKNSDYYFSLDASTLCAKRLLYQGTFDYVQHQLPDEVFTPEDLIDLANIMHEMGYETPCGICYVESRRRWLDTYAGEFLEKLPENAEDFIEKYFKKASKKDKEYIREHYAEWKPSLSLDNLTTSDGLESLRHDNPYMHQAFVKAMNKKGNNNPKVVQLRTAYRGDISKLSAEDIQKVKDIGGLRIQSFSDFETPHLLDMVQAVYDMASVGLTSQAYTKVPNFAWVFGDTGIKINLSLIGLGTGLDENGKLVFDNREGMNFEEAMKLRDRYNANVGTIIVGINDDHIIAAMADPRIDYIIPFHKSGWSKEELEKMATLRHYSDYTYYQNEVLIVGDKKHKIREVNDLTERALDSWITREGNDHPGYKVIEQGDGKFTVTYDEGYETESFKTHKQRTGEVLTNFEPVGAHQYWDFSQSGEWNARKYLQMCAEAGRIPKFSQFLVDNGDGTFSLPEGDDERSRAIREGYWKTLVDFKMYENDSYGRTREDRTRTEVKGAPQTEVTPNINMNEAYRVLDEHQLGRQMPDKPNGEKGKFIPMESNNDTPVATDAGDRFIEVIKDRRRGKKPSNPPPDTLKAKAPVISASKGESFFGQGASEEVNMNAATTLGTTQAPAELGNTESTGEEINQAQQRQMAIDPETGETVDRYSLPSVNPVNPISGVWQRGATFDEVKSAHPSLFEQSEDQTDEDRKKHDTQTTSTIHTYRKVYDMLKSEGFSGSILDASSGLGKGTMLGRDEFGFNVTDIEPYHGEDYSPMYEDYSTHQGTYDFIISNAVLNVLPQDQRDSMVITLGKMLNPGGRMFVNVRGKEVADAKSAIPINEDNMEYFIEKGNSYQKGFTQAELNAYLQDALGQGFTVETIKGIGTVSAIVTKNNENKNERYSLPSDTEYLDAVKRGDMGKAQEMVDEAAKDKGLTIFDKEYPTIQSLYEGLKKGELLVHARRMDPAEASKMTWLEPGWGETMLGTEAEGWYDEQGQERPQLIFASDDTTWSQGERNGLIFVRRADFQRSNGDGTVTLPDGTTIPYEMSPMADYDSETYREEPFGIEGGDWYTNQPVEVVAAMPFYAKSADPVTYKDDGTPIPLSQRFNSKEQDYRYSIPSDARYFSAIDHGEMDEVERMVKEAAEKNGYVLTAYHGTGEYFTTFNRGDEGIHLGNEEQAQQVAERRYKELAKKPVYKWGSIKNRINEMDGPTRRSLVDQAYQMFEYDDIKPFSGNIYNDQEVRDYVENLLFGSDDYDEPDTAYFFFPESIAPKSERVMKLYAKISNPFTINDDISYWSAQRIAYVLLARSEGETEFEEYYDITGSDISLDAEEKEILTQVLERKITGDDAWDAISDVLLTNTYDGIRYMNKYEGSGDAYSYIALNASDVKSADAITYDDNGKPIPLSQRFNQENDDIRYMLPTDRFLDEQINGYLNGVNLGQPTPGKPQRQFGSQTIQTVEDAHPVVKEWLKGHSDYDPDTNEAQIDRAIKWVMGHKSDIDPDGFWGAIEEIERDDFNPLTADGQAKMYVLASLAANKGDKGLSIQIRLADAINRQGTELGRALQARRLYRLMTPAGRIAVLQKEVSRVNAELKSRGKKGNVTLSQWTLLMASSAQNEEEFFKAQQAMWEELGGQVPATFWERLQAWRMVSMLGNPRTHIRNTLGNLAFAPAKVTKDKIGAILENLFLSESDERTKALKVDKAALEFAEMDMEKVRSKLTGEAKYDDWTQLTRNKKPFGRSFLGNMAQAWSDVSSEWLEKEDWWFLSYHYKNSLAGWMTANKVTAKQFEDKPELLDKARAYAINEAQKATYRDANVVANALNKLDKIPGLRVISTAVLPFKRTPLNILKRGFEYSPIGLLKNMTADVVRLIAYNRWARGETEGKPKWAISPTEYIDKLSAGLTGSGIAMIGALLNNLGCLTLGFKRDDPEDEIKKKKGYQEYSITFNLFGQEINYTIDWMAPVCMPFFVGAVLNDLAQKSGKFDFGQLITGLGVITEPLMNLSVMDGAESLFKTSQYEDTNVYAQIAAKIGMNYLNSFIPTIVGQTARWIDPTRRKQYVRSGDQPSSVLYSLEQMQNKTPWSVYNIPYRDARGNESRKGWFGALLENYFSPGYVNIIQDDPTIDEMVRLYRSDLDNQKENFSKVIPSDADKSFTIKGESHKLTDKEYDQLDVSRKQIAFGLLDELVKDPYYQNSDIVDDHARINMVSDVWTYATQQAKYEMYPELDREDWIRNAQKNGVDILDVIKHRCEDQIEQDWVDGWSQQLVTAIEDGDNETATLAAETLELHDEDVDIDKIVKDGFIKRYQKAYKDNRPDDMEAIEDILYNAGFDFDYDSWLKNVVKNEDKWLQQFEPED